MPPKKRLRRSIPLFFFANAKKWINKSPPFNGPWIKILPRYAICTFRLCNKIFIHQFCTRVFVIALQKYSLIEVKGNDLSGRVGYSFVKETTFIKSPCKSYQRHNIDILSNFLPVFPFYPPLLEFQHTSANALASILIGKRLIILFVFHPSISAEKVCVQCVPQLSWNCLYKCRVW